MTKALFGIIALLMLAIVGVGLYDVSLRSQTIGDTSQTATVENTATSSTTQTTQSTQTPPTQAPGTYTLAQIATHNSVSSCWTTINGGVYDVTKWINQHPGGSDAILSLCGTDGSSAFNDQHGGQRRPANELASFKIGTLAK
jgi:cytochrome b involved in lipid metabolism